MAVSELRVLQVLPFQEARTLALFAAVIVATAALIYAAGRQTRSRSLLAQQVQSSHQLDLYAGAFDALIEHYRALPAVMALDPDIRLALTHDVDAAEQLRLNRKLEQIDGGATSSTLTLLDSRGHAIATSNWRTPDSNVGTDFSFRPYFRQLMSQDQGRFFGVGIITGIPAYFLSAAVHDDEGKLLGGVVVKLELAGLERAWSRSSDIVLMSDRYGIVFLANRAEWHYYELHPLSSAQRAELTSDRTYPLQALQAPVLRRTQALADGASLVQIGPAGSSLGYLWTSRPMPDEDWTLHLLTDTTSIAHAAHVAELATGGACLACLFLGLFLQQRSRLAQLQQRSREELEQLVQQHAAAMRSVQDNLIKAAGMAADGRSESVQHLPQGVSVVDAQMRLVAWNRRYLELLRLPAQLLVAGRPIEDILRFNAARGLLGPGNMEESIRRRLEHLRAAKPYVVEREWPDGTVLEIRGNPLPAGGFVTSYTDITAYRSTARELRSLATTLEQQVTLRTHELQQAQHEAEQANRSKTRYVAAVVHDLQQPLNAMRMFLSVLHDRLRELDRDGTSLRLAVSLEDALTAQDAILSSLFDIARLESGAIQTHIRDFSLGLLIDTLRREFGLLAQSRELELHWLDTHCVVRSDEAMLRRILQNFLSNAVRYTRKGRVLIGCRRSGAAVRIEVWDTGPGIPPQQHEAIFEEFRRFDTGDPGTEHGAGLGLAIVQRAARLLGHEVGLRSRPGYGSVFYVCVPLGEAANLTIEPATPSIAHDSALPGRRIWCIDDDPRIREASRVLLEKWGCQVELAAGATDALGLARSKDRPDLLLVDYRLAGPNGVELLQQLEAYWQSLPSVILLTADRSPELAQQAHAQGWGILYKPVRPPALRALMSQLLTRAHVL